MANSKLLKEAIADAKAVKETALANAKLALEEAFTPRLQSILSQKMRQEAEMEDDNTVCANASCPTRLAYMDNEDEAMMDESMMGKANKHGENDYVTNN